MTWLDYLPTVAQERMELDRRDLHESIAADRRERADRHADQYPSSSTSAARRSPPPDGVASCSETLEVLGAVFSSDARDLPVVGATARSSSTSSTGLASRAEDADGLSADDLADWQHAQALTSDGVCLTCLGSGEVVWNPSWRGDPQMEQSARCPECCGSGGGER